MAVITCLVGAASANLPKQSIYGGIFGGATIALDDWDLHEVPDAGISPKPFVPTLGVRLGGTIGYWVSVEASVGFLMLSSDTSGTANQALTYTGDVLVNLLASGDWVPFVSAGGGAYHNISSDFGSDLDYRAHGGVGVRGLLTDWLIFRADLKYVLTDGYTGSRLANNIEVLVGLDVLLWASSDKKPDNDWDKDGILNPDDKCPRTPGHATAAGCPDRDGDGIVDSKDRCPDTAGPVKHQGCPDTDKDGIVDIEDDCVNTPGLPAFKGCPDTDKDGIEDRKDTCPKTPGMAKYQGCPDTDHDTVIDPKDKCPKTPGVPELQGCPADKPLVLEGVNFDYNKASLLPASKAILDRVGKTMTEYPKMVVRITGHTDSDGSAAHNRKLSLRRAETVRSYLHAQHQVALNRMRVAGRGESQPRATNKTPEGRAQNRRIEFQLISKSGE